MIYLQPLQHVHGDSGGTKVFPFAPQPSPVRYWCVKCHKITRFPIICQTCQKLGCWLSTYCCEECAGQHEPFHQAVRRRKARATAASAPASTSLANPMTASTSPANHEPASTSPTNPMAASTSQKHQPPEPCSPRPARSPVAMSQSPVDRSAPETPSPVVPRKLKRKAVDDSRSCDNASGHNSSDSAIAVSLTGQFDIIHDAQKAKMRRASEKKKADSRGTIRSKKKVKKALNREYDFMAEYLEGATLD